MAARKAKPKEEVIEEVEEVVAAPQQKESEVEKSTKKMVKVRVVNPSVKVNGRVVVVDVDNPKEARLLPIQMVKLPYKEPFDISEDIFSKLDRPFDFASVLRDMLPTDEEINLAFWGAYVVTREHAMRVGWIQNALARAFPDARAVYVAIRDKE